MRENIWMSYAVGQVELRMRDKRIDFSARNAVVSASIDGTKPRNGNRASG